MRAHEVTSFDDDLARLVTRMRLLMHDARGVGLAATQVGILQRVFVFQRGEDDVVAVVNPVLSERSDERATRRRGLPVAAGRDVPVERHLRLTLEGQDPEGNELQLELEGQPARVVQHETRPPRRHADPRSDDDEARKEALAVLRPRPILAAS